VVLLVLLRLNIGWHFYSEGMSHYTDPEWTSANVLRAAKGPLAPTFRSYLPEYQDLQTLAAAEDMKAVDAWLQTTAESLAVEKQRFADFYKFDEAQQAAAEKLLKLRQDQIRAWGPDNQEDLETYIHERKRLATQQSEPAAKDVPFKKQRIAAKQAELRAQESGWLADLQAVRKGFQSELAALRTNDQLERGLPPQPQTRLSKVDKVMLYGIMGIGVCLILGLFTRLACLLGAAFLVSVVLTQPFWVSDAQPTFNQWVEMIALLVLASTNVGKWGGLDFFLSCLFGGCCRGKTKQS
jgi:uncharacterized membrane protein YphA (DoxX/SURF4 family)